MFTHPRSRRPWRVGLALVAACSLFSVPASVCAQSPIPAAPAAAALDSALTALRAPDWETRHAALARINEGYPSALPATVAPPLLDLLAREAASSGNHEGDEAFGEYLVDLIVTAVRTRDERAIPNILALGGLGVSSGVEDFVASQGRAVMPVLDSLADTREDRASDVAETYALMYAHFGGRLGRADSARVLRRLVDLAQHPSPAVRAQVADVAGKGTIVELTALVAYLSAADSATIAGIGGFPVRQDALAALPALRQALTTLPTPELLNRLTLLTDAACLGADPRLATSCTALTANLAAAARAVAAGQPRTALKSLDAYQRTVQRLAADGSLPRLTATSLDGTARFVVDRLL